MTSETSYHLGEVMRRIREYSGVSLEDYARRIGMTEFYVEQIEAGGGHRPNPHEVDALREITGIDACTIFICMNPVSDNLPPKLVGPSVALRQAWIEHCGELLTALQEMGGE